jgi:hypothetical protein
MEGGGEGRGRGGRGEGKGNASAWTRPYVRTDSGVRPCGRTVSVQTHPSVRTNTVFTVSTDGKNPSAGKTVSAG